MQDKLENIKWLKNSFDAPSLTFNLPTGKNIGQTKIVTLVAQFLELHPTIRVLNFFSNRLNPEAISFLGPILKQLSLTSIDLSNNKMTDETFAQLSAVLKDCPLLTHLNFYQNAIKNEGAIAFAGFFDDNQRLVELNLGVNKIESEGVAALSRAFRNNRRIQLSLSQNPIGSRGAEILSMDLHIKLIDELKLRKSKMEDTGIAALSLPLQTHPTITTFIINGNCIGEKAAKGLSLVFEKNLYLTDVDLAGNQIGSTEAILLSVGLKKNHGLEILNLSFNAKMELEGIKAVTEALQNHPTLRAFYFMANQLKDEGAQSIADLLMRNTQITSLHIESNQIGVRGGQSIANASAQNKIIKTLEISGNPIGNDGAISFANAVKNHSSITYLALKNTDIGEQGGLALASALKSNTTLTQCNVDLLQEGVASEMENAAKAFIETLEINRRLIQFELRSKLISEETKHKIQTCAKNNLKSAQKEQANQFTQIMIILARTATQSSSLFWGALPQEVKASIIYFFCLPLSRKIDLGKSHDQLLYCADFVFQNIATINQKIAQKSPVKILEKIPKTGKSTFLFFQPNVESSPADKKNVNLDMTPGFLHN